VLGGGGGGSILTILQYKTDIILPGRGVQENFQKEVKTLGVVGSKPV
jgi:hypothetical protein